MEHQLFWLVFSLVGFIIGVIFTAIIIYGKQKKKLEQAFEIRLNLERTAIEQNSNIKLMQWKNDYEGKIRKDAITRSQSSLVGKITEHLVPYIGNFPYNPRDVKFIGSPFDLLVINGMDAGTITEIVFVEIKTGKYANLTGRERQIRNAIKAGKIRWEEIKIDRKDN